MRTSVPDATSLDTRSSSSTAERVYKVSPSVRIEGETFIYAVSINRAKGDDTEQLDAGFETELEGVRRALTAYILAYGAKRNANKFIRRHNADGTTSTFLAPIPITDNTRVLNSLFWQSAVQKSILPAFQHSKLFSNRWPGVRLELQSETMQTLGNTLRAVGRHLGGVLLDTSLDVLSNSVFPLRPEMPGRLTLYQVQEQWVYIASQFERAMEEGSETIPFTGKSWATIHD